MMLNALKNLTPVSRMGLIVLGVLAVASVAVALLRWAKPQKDFKELVARVRAWWMMAAVFFGALVVSNPVALVFFAFLSFWAMKEYITLLKTRPADHHGLVFTFLAIPIQYYLIGINWYGMFIIFIPVYMFLSLPVRLVLSKETGGFVASASQIQWGLMAFVFGLSHMAFLLTVPELKGATRVGPYARVVSGLCSRDKRRAAIRVGQDLRPPQDHPGRKPEQDVGGLYRRHSERDCE